MRTVDEILDKIKQLKGLKRDVELANSLGVQPSTVANWRARKTLPYEVIVSICEKEGIHISWLLTGQINTKYLNIDGKEVLVMSGEPGLYKKGEEKPSTIAEEDAIYNKVKGDSEMEEIVDILKDDLPEAKRAVLRLLKYRKGIKESVQNLVSIDKPLKEEG